VPAAGSIADSSRSGRRSGTHQADGGAHPWAVVVKALDAVVIDAAVVGSWRLVEVACIIVPHCHLVAIGQDDLLGPAGTGQGALVQCPWPSRGREPGAGTLPCRAAGGCACGCSCMHAAREAAGLLTCMPAWDAPWLAATRGAALQRCAARLPCGTASLCTPASSRMAALEAQGWRSGARLATQHSMACSGLAL
jgi:hypothetical protein